MPPEGAKDPKQEAQGPQKEPKATKKLSARAKIYGTMHHNILILIYRMLASVSVYNCCADFLGMLSPFGQFEVMLEPAQQGPPAF